MTPDEIFQLRLRAYSKALDRQEKQKLKKTGFVDKYDLLPNVKYFHQEGFACCRVHFGPPFPCNDPETFDYVPLNGAAEVSRLCIEPTICGCCTACSGKWRRRRGRANSTRLPRKICAKSTRDGSASKTHQNLSRPSLVQGSTMFGCCVSISAMLRCRKE